MAIHACDVRTYVVRDQNEARHACIAQQTMLTCLIISDGEVRRQPIVCAKRAY